MKQKYKIMCTDAKSSIDGKDHYSIMKRIPPIADFISESWERAINKTFDTEEEAENALKELMK